MGDEQRGDLVWFTTESSCATKRGESNTEGSDEPKTIQDLDEMNDQLRSTKKELDDMTKTMLAMEEDRDMWRKLFEDCNKKQGQEIERLRQEYKETIGAGGVDDVH